MQPTRRRLSLVNSEMKGFEADGLTDNVVAEEVRLNTRVGRVSFLLIIYSIGWCCLKICF